jgi:hypothetical protein
MPLSFTPLLRFKLLQACDQCHSSQVPTFLTGWTVNCVQTLKVPGGELAAAPMTSYEIRLEYVCTVRVFRQKFTLEDAIGSHACSLEALAGV